MKTKLDLWRKVFMGIIVMVLFNPLNSQAQCSSCDFTYPGGTNPYNGQNLNGSKKLCFTSGTYSGSFGNFNGNNNSICIAPGATVNWNKDFNSLDIDVYGTLNFNGGNFNGQISRINVHSGGQLNIASSISQVSNVIITVDAGGGMLIQTSSSFSFQNNGGLQNSGTVNASQAAELKFGNNTGLLNSGIINAKGLLISGPVASGGNAVARRNTGNIILTQYVSFQGYYENATGGHINVVGPCSGGNCGLSNTDQGSNKLINNGEMLLSGGMTVNGPMDNNGAIHINGDLTINKPISGNAGIMDVNNGNSRINSGGAYSGTGMLFCDQTTSNHDFRYGAGTGYTVNCSPANAALPLHVLSFDVVEKNDVQLYFIFNTADEVNVGWIELQVSDDGSSFRLLEKFTARNTAGPNRYQSANYAQSTGRFFRLAIVDLDGKREYSKTIHISATQATEWQLFPNPVKGNSFTVQTNNLAPITVMIFSVDGRSLYSSHFTGSKSYLITVPASALQSRQWMVKIIGDGQNKSWFLIHE